MEWYVYYLIAGFYIAILSYGISAYYKLSDNGYVARFSIFGIRQLFGVITITILWVLYIPVLAGVTMKYTHTLQLLKELQEKLNKTEEPI